MPLFEEKENNVEMEKSIDEYLFVFFFDNYHRKISMVKNVSHFRFIMSSTDNRDVHRG
jgi:hypothetical protein